jgi:NADPH-dependent 7-cyano-7-deazaguanine reductase QueF
MHSFVKTFRTSSKFEEDMFIMIMTKLLQEIENNKRTEFFMIVLY